MVRLAESVFVRLAHYSRTWFRAKPDIAAFPGPVPIQESPNSTISAMEGRTRAFGHIAAFRVIESPETRSAASCVDQKIRRARSCRCSGGAVAVHRRGGATPAAKSAIFP